MYNFNAKSFEQIMMDFLPVGSSGSPLGATLGRPELVCRANACGCKTMSSDFDNMYFHDIRMVFLCPAGVELQSKCLSEDMLTFTLTIPLLGENII